MIIPGFIITWITFPGVIIHELAHKLFCQWTGTKVLQVCYFRFGNPAGFVVHEAPSSVWRSILIGVGPLFVNTAIGFAVGLLIIPLKNLGSDLGAFFTILVVWLSVSIAMHSFPSTGDARSIWSAVWRKEVPIAAKIVSVPIVGMIFVGAVGSVVWLDLLYGIGVVAGLPYLLNLS